MNDILNKIKAIDSEKMYKSINSFPVQIEKSYDLKVQNIMKNISITEGGFTNIIICGMGGSAIGGNLCKTLIDFDININIFINKEYKLPNWVLKSSLVIISSYSGNTEETISCYNECIKKNISPVVITTGGYLLDKAKKNNNVYIEIPKGYQPRAALGFSFTLIFLFINKLNLINNKNLKKQINSSVQLLKEFNVEMFSNNNAALDLASEIYNKYIVIYSSQTLESISYRFRCQLAENSKIISSHSIFPEQNHNEIEAFQNSNVNNIAFIWLSDKSDSKKITHRMKITKDLLSNIGSHYSICFNKVNRVGRILKMISYVDWISYYCAILNNTDPSPVNKIKRLKALL